MNRTSFSIHWLAMSAAFAFPLAAKVVGNNVPAQGLTATRVATLPDNDRLAWANYLDRSWAQMVADRAALAAEWIDGAPVRHVPAPKNQSLNIPLDQPDEWYAGTEGRRRADTIISFQTPAGGWSKNQNRAGEPRKPGQAYANDSENTRSDMADYDNPKDRFWTFVGTLDNGATTSEMRFLARVASTLPSGEGDAYRASFIKGVQYLLAAQYPNGGWPQIWPLEGGFHDAVTFNDNAVAKAAMLLEDVGEGKFAFVPKELQLASAGSAHRALDVVLASQITVEGKRTCWPQQVDPLTLAPSSARNYEPRSIATSESVDVLRFLMRQSNPSEGVQSAVKSCIMWLYAHKIRDLAFEDTPQGRRSFYKMGNVIWARNYDIATGKPIFGDRDKTIRDTANELSDERLNNYSWYNNAPAGLLIDFEQWRKSLPVSKSG